MLSFLRKVPAFKDLRYKQMKGLISQIQITVKTRGSQLFQQGDKADYIYVIRQGEVRNYLKQFEDKPNFMETETKKIFQ